MANPRKFSEKIALLNQKEAEGNAEFERIMREVSEVSSKVDKIVNYPAILHRKTHIKRRFQSAKRRKNIISI